MRAESRVAYASKRPQDRSVNTLTSVQEDFGGKTEDDGASPSIGDTRVDKLDQCVANTVWFESMTTHDCG